MIIRQKAGNLRHGRRGHGAIFDGEKFLIIGGHDVSGEVENEVCTLKGSRMTCIAQSTATYGYANYPELFLVDEDYGKDFNKC